MAKPKKKYCDIINTSKDLFWKYGIKRVTVEEICEEAGVSKMTFYRYFNNKTEVAKSVIDLIFSDGLDQYREIMNRNISFKEKVKLQLLKKHEGIQEISHEFIQDVYNSQDPEIRKHWEAWRDRMLKEVVNDYAIAQEKGWIRKEINLDFILYINNKMTEMVNDQNLIALYNNDVQKAVMEVANLFFFGILTRDDETHE